MRQIKIFIWVLADIFALGILVVSRAPAQKLPPKKERRRLRGGTASALGALKSFAGITLDGEMFTQKDIAAKDITIINFWTLTCGSCLVELPDLAAFAGALPDNVRMMTVCVDGGGDPEIRRIRSDPRRSAVGRRSYRTGGSDGCRVSRYPSCGRGSGDEV